MISETLLQVSEEARNVRLSICLAATGRKPTEKKGKGNKARQQMWQQEICREQNKRIKVAATINWKGTMPPLGKICGK